MPCIGRTNQAIAWIIDYLRTHDGSADSQEVKGTCFKEGYAWSTIGLAAKKMRGMGILDIKLSGFASMKKSTWTLIGKGKEGGDIFLPPRKQRKDRKDRKVRVKNLMSFHIEDTEKFG